jgi:DNA adenine methylase
MKYNPKCKSPLLWPGGKYLMRKQIVETYLPKCVLYAEAFAGALHVLFAKEPGKEVINDINGNLINFYRVIKDKPEKFLNEVQLDLVSRELFDEYKDTLKNTDMLTDVEKAHLFYYVMKQSFNGKMSCYGYKRGDYPILNLYKLPEKIFIAHNRLKKTNIESLDWKIFLQKYDAPGTHFFLDPPYLCESAREIYEEYFKEEDYHDLKIFVQNMKGTFTMTLNKHPLFLKLFTNFYIDEIDNRCSMKKNINRQVTELVIYNFEKESDCF